MKKEVNMKFYEKISCLYCNKDKFVLKSVLKRRGGKYCDSICCNSHRKDLAAQEPKNAECAYCKKKFRARKSKMLASKSGYMFCQKECKDIAQRSESGFNEMRPAHYKNGGSHYKAKAMRNFENKCNRCSYSKVIGILEVHHKDRDRNNNNLSNLEILCPNCHQEEHFKTKTGRF